MPRRCSAPRAGNWLCRTLPGRLARACGSGAGSGQGGAAASSAAAAVAAAKGRPPPCAPPACPADPGTPVPRAAAPQVKKAMTMTEKILAKHSDKPAVVPGDNVRWAVAWR